MELQNNVEEVTPTHESIIAPLKKVTPLSKYLALALFIILPFVGAWVGYQYVTEKDVMMHASVTDKFVQTNTVVTKNAEIIKNDHNSNVSNLIQIQASSTISDKQSIASYECFSKENNYPHTCFSFKPANQSKPTIENLSEQAKKQGVINGRTTLNSVTYTTANNRKIYFTVGVPDSDACCAVIVFDSETSIFKPVEMYKGVSMSFWSSDKRYFASIENNITINVTDLETGKVIARQVISTGNLVSTVCSFFGDGYDVIWNEQKQGFEYGVYSDKTETGDSCKQIKMSEDFLPIK